MTILVIFLIKAVVFAKVSCPEIAIHKSRVYENRTKENMYIPEGHTAHYREELSSKY